MTAYIAAMMIRLYQRYISPYKGFRCAHRALHGGPSCSEFARLHVLDHGVWTMLAALRMRFQECRVAKYTLMMASGNKAANTKKLTPRPGIANSAAEPPISLRLAHVTRCQLMPVIALAVDECQ